MPRPCKRRRICAMPACGHFGPKEAGNGTGQEIVMTLDEFECIRLIDLESMTQEQCAERMNVARTTVQAIYGSARAKLAECLVMGKELVIRGGDYVICDGMAKCCGCRRRCQKMIMEGKKMKIAVTYEDGQIFQHFGHTEQFKVYDVEDGKVTGTVVVDTNGSGHGALAGFLKDQQVEVLICGGIGGGARMALDEMGIRLYGGVSGDADEAVNALISGNLDYNPDVMCSHHGHGGHGEHSCGHHGEHEGSACGSHCGDSH